MKTEQPLSFDSDNVQEILNNLSEQYRFFVSEKHFQVAFTIEMAKKYPEYDYYPEYSPSNGMYYDLMVKTPDETIVIEFKYLTAPFSEPKKGLNLCVKSHQALDIRRYDCWKDISRIESFSDKWQKTRGFFVLVTNAKSYWRESGRNTLDKYFRINEGQHSGGDKRMAGYSGRGNH